MLRLARAPRLRQTVSSRVINTERFDNGEDCGSTQVEQRSKTTVQDFKCRSDSSVNMLL